MVDRIMADPKASREELLWLAKKSPLDALHHPNSPADLWWDLVPMHPLAAMDSVLYGMMTLEEPGRWEEIQQTHLGAWIGFYCARLSLRQSHLYGAECAERVLPFFHERYPNDARPREAIRIRRLFAEGLATREQWEAASYAADESAGECMSPEASTAARATAWGLADEVAQAASMAMAKATFGPSLPWNDAVEAEHRWQWNRLLQYIRGEVK